MVSSVPATDILVLRKTYRTEIRWSATVKGWTLDAGHDNWAGSLYPAGLHQTARSPPQISVNQANVERLALRWTVHSSCMGSSVPATGFLVLRTTYRTLRRCSATVKGWTLDAGHDKWAGSLYPAGLTPHAGVNCPWQLYDFVCASNRLPGAAENISHWDKMVSNCAGSRQTSMKKHSAHKEIYHTTKHEKRMHDSKYQRLSNQWL
jgi:hypothetical protein